MQAISTTPTTAMRPASGYASEVTSGAVTAVQEPKTITPDSTTVNLSDEAMDRYATDRKEESDSPVQQTEQQAAGKINANEGGSDGVAETLEKLHELLKEAQERLRAAQQQMFQAMAEMKSAKDEAQRMAAMVKVQAAQMQVITAQGEVLQIYAQINDLMEEQQQAGKA